MYFLQATFFLSTYYQIMMNSCTNHEKRNKKNVKLFTLVESEFNLNYVKITYKRTSSPLQTRQAMNV